MSPLIPRRLLLTAGLLASLVPAANASDRPPAAAKTRVFILAGQSNMEGKGDASKLTSGEKAALERTRAHIKFAFNHEPVGPLHFRPGSPGTRKKFGVDEMFGPEIFFSLKLAERWPDQDFLIIKRAVGGTSLYGRWNPDWTVEKATVMGEEKAEPLYADMIGYIREILAAYPANSYEIAGMLWVQGEADGNVSVRGPKPGADYGANLANLIKRVRKDLNVPDLPFIIMQVGGPPVVAGMRATAAALPRVTFVPQSPEAAAPNYLPKYPAGHYNYEGQKRIGTLMAQAYFENYAPTK